MPFVKRREMMCILLVGNMICRAYHFFMWWIIDFRLMILKGKKQL